MVAIPAAIPEATMEVWITKDHSGSRLWTKKPSLDPDTYLFIGGEAVCIPESFTIDWINGTRRRLVIRQPGSTI